MIDSTARAPRVESESGAPAYVWAPPDKPVSVSIPLALIAPLERGVVEAFRSISSRGSEIGGVLFGTVAAGSPAVVAIETFEPVECDYAAGPLYRLSDAELARLDRLVEQRAAAGVRAVGFYRSHTRKGLSLDATDLALFETRFRDPHHIALVIRPAAGKPSIAGIFIRENGAVRAESSCLEFPFRATAQDPGKLAPGLYDGAVAGPRSVNAAPAPPRPAIRAQIVPIASRRDAPPETPLPEPVAAVHEPAAAPEPPAAPERQRVAASAPAPEAAPEPPVVKAAEPETEPVVIPAKSGSSKLLWIAMGALLSVVLSVGFVVSSGVLHRGRSIPTAANQDNSPLALRVERNGADIVLTWNRDSDAIKKAGRAVLQIADGAQHENVDMDLAQLRNGSIVYTPVTGDVVFRMEVSGAGQSTTQSESVRVLRTRPSPLDPPAAPEQQAQATPAPKPAETATGPSAAEEEKEKEKEKPVEFAQAVRPFRAESLAQRLRPASATEIPDTPAIGGGMPAPTANVNLGNLISTQAAPPAPAPAASSAPSALPTGAKPGGQIVQAQLLRRRDPEYPKLARDAGAGGVVELIATVGADGRVKAVQVVRGHTLLRQPAVDAVRSWVYRPTLLNGVPVESQTQVLLNFKSER